MKKGDRLAITIAGRRLEGVIELASQNGRSLIVLFDEGVPLPFGIYEGKQCLLLFRADDGSWSDLQGGRSVQVG
jgi:hypothetical protein